MKRRLIVFAFIALFSTFSLASVGANIIPNNQEGRHGKEHGTGVKQYDVFHDELHPLQHEALPQNDFRRIREKSARLANRGKAILKLGVPRGTTAENRPEFVSELEKFSVALTKFRSDAKRGTDDQLKASFSAVHDSFEMLAARLPRSR